MQLDRGRLPNIGCLDRPGPVAVENSKVVVQGWIAGSAPVHEIRMSIDDIQVGTVSEPDVCRDLLLPDYENANKFAFRLPSVSLPNRVDQDVNFSATAHFVTGERFAFHEQST
jgi:hypothetical protein